MESILTSIKKLIGFTEEYTQFDVDIMMHINTVFARLHQMGVGPKAGYVVYDKKQTWSEFLGDLPIDTEIVKSLVYLRVKLLFDPPTSSFVLESMKENIKEFEWCVYVAVDNWNDENK